MGVHNARAEAVTHWHDQHGLIVRPQTLASDNGSVFALKLPWLTITSRGAPVEPEVGIKTARSSSLHVPAATSAQGERQKCPRSA